MRNLLRTISLFIAISALTTAAEAQQRVFVSAAHGDDLNACTPTAPCRSFAHAITVVTPGGEILALDSGGYGPVSIGISVSIVSPPGIEGAITQTASGQNAIDISASGATVILRGLSLFGLGSGNDGIRTTAVGALIVDSCNASGFQFSGIEFDMSARGTLSVSDSAFLQNNANGIYMYGTAGGLAVGLVDHCRLESNGFAGLNLFEGSSGIIRDSSACNNGVDGIVAQTQAAGQLTVLEIEHCVVSGNSYGIGATGGGSGAGSEVVHVTNCLVAHNLNYGVISTDANAHLWSRSNNTVQDNATNGFFTDFFTGS